MLFLLKNSLGLLVLLEYTKFCYTRVPGAPHYQKTVTRQDFSGIFNNEHSGKSSKNIQGEDQRISVIEVTLEVIYPALYSNYLQQISENYSY